MKHVCILLSNFSTRNARCCCILAFCCLLSWFPCNAPVLASDPGFYPDTILGTPDEFLESFRNNTKSQLDNYLGAGIAITGFILVVRSLVK